MKRLFSRKSHKMSTGKVVAAALVGSVIGATVGADGTYVRTGDAPQAGRELWMPATGQNRRGNISQARERWKKLRIPIPPREKFRAVEKSLPLNK
jgi:hypothetical protein